MVSHESEGGFCYVFVQNKHIRSLFAISLGKNTQLKEVVSHQQSIYVYLLICLYGLICVYLLSYFTLMRVKGRILWRDCFYTPTFKTKSFSYNQFIYPSLCSYLFFLHNSPPS